MPSALERRLDRLAGALGSSDDEARIYYCTDEAEAERLLYADPPISPRPAFCIVNGKSALGPTMTEMFAHIAKHGRRIHDKPTDALPADHAKPRIVYRSKKARMAA